MTTTRSIQYHATLCFNQINDLVLSTIWWRVLFRGTMMRTGWEAIICDRSPFLRFVNDVIDRLPLSCIYPAFSVIFAARKRSLRRLCFYTCLSVGVPGQVPPPRPGTPSGTRYTFWDQVPPRTRYTPQTRYPLGRYTPRAGTPPLGRYPPRTRYTPREQCMLGDTGNKRAVRILLECILVLLKLYFIEFI